VVIIRCHPYVPVAVEELDLWLEQEAERLRRETPGGGVRLSRLEQTLPSGNVCVGWLLELDAPEGESLLGTRLTATLAALRLLGVQPTILAPDGLSGDSTAIWSPVILDAHEPSLPRLRATSR
jgi:hypothetical protein